MPLDIVVGERPSAVFPRHLTGSLPAGGISQVHHASKQPPVGADAEDGGSNDAVQVGIGWAVHAWNYVLPRWCSPG